MNVIMPLPVLHVWWGCRRCGKTDGIARTTMPIDADDEPMMRALFDALRLKLVRVHARDGCIATVEDFTFRKRLEALHAR